MKKFLLFIYMVCVSTLLIAETKVGAEVNVSSGLVRIKETNIEGIPITFENPENFWITTGSAKVKIDTGIKDSVKAYIEGIYNVNSIPEMEIKINDEEKTIEAGAEGKFTLTKVYTKIKFPFFYGQSLKLTAGKQPLSWGYGLYYNAGDLIFGASPSTELNTSSLSSSGLSDLRTLTDWIFSVSFPIGKYFTFEALSLPPVEVNRNSKYGRFGARSVIRTNFSPLENIEIGFISQGNMDEQKIALSLDGSIFADYNLCSSVTFDSFAFCSEKWNVSLSINKIVSIQTDVSSHSLNMRVEGLWYPKNEYAGLFAFMSYNVTDIITLSGNYLWSGNNNNYYDNEHFIGMTLGIEPVKSLEITLQGLFECKNPGDTCTILGGIKYCY